VATALVWFRQDLRLADNPALARALGSCERVIPLYVHAPQESGGWAPGGASRWWLHYSLASLAKSLEACGSRLVIRRGESLEALRRLARESGASHVFWNRLYEPAHIERDKRVEQALREQGLAVESANAALLFEPWEMTKDDGAFYKVFTPFWNACVGRGLPVVTIAAPEHLPALDASLASENLGSLGLLPDIPWDTGLREAWEPGEDGAQARLRTFLDEALSVYGENRNRPDLQGTSRLSPHLHFGEIGPRQVVTAVRHQADALPSAGLAKNAEAYVREIGWREFSYHLLHHFPHMPERPLNPRFDAFPWVSDYAEVLTAWQHGGTGIPIVDAGMRELWTSGWMHNRVRMIVASLLTKNLLVPWQEGAAWFWDTLVDADLANNTQGWQWTAGCGADAAPYFRIFNPVLQGARFDPCGDYVRRWVPELARLPDKYLQRPWEAPAAVLFQAGLRLGEDYPLPLVNLAASRARALERFEQTRS
jgi:deoxyribodipyrimidine photo-lyase